MRRLSLLALPLLALAACRTEPAAPATDPATDPATTAVDTTAATPQVASATLESRSGSSVTGTVTFTKEPTGVRIVANLAGLTPGDHGFHVHENGDCSAPDASSAGSHFTPNAHPHGRPTDAETARHAGDMGNVTADAQGNATLDITDTVMQMEGPSSIVGKSVIVHEKADDFSQPVGNAGGRLACGVIAMGGSAMGAGTMGTAPAGSGTPAAGQTPSGAASAGMPATGDTAAMR